MTLNLPKKEICDKYNVGTSANKLGKEYGCDGATIIRLLKKNGVKVRTQTESKRQMYVNDPTITERQSESKRQLYVDDPTYAVRIGKSMKLIHDNDHTLAERSSAIQQGQDYDNGEWTGFTDRGRPHLIPTAQCVHLNPWFEGCVRHHITTGVIIHIPVDLHKSVWHRMPNGDRKERNMKEINKLAFKYLLGRL